MTSTTHTGTQLRLPGQTAVHEGPVDMSMMYIAHHAFRRDLDAFALAVPATPVEARGAWTAMTERFDAFAKVLHLHHTGEDTGLWPMLLAHVDAVGDAAGRQTLEDMESEHAAFDPLLAAMGEGLRRLSGGGTADDRAALAVHAAAARDGLGHHLMHEETEALALVQRHVTQVEWDRMDEEHFTSHRLSLRELAFVVPWLCLDLPDDVRERAFAATGKGFQALHLLTRRRFARHHRRAFAHA